MSLDVNVCKHAYIYTSRSQPSKTHGPLGKTCIDSRTTTENCSTSALWL